MTANVLISLGLFAKKCFVGISMVALCGAATCSGTSSQVEEKKSNNRTELAKDFLSRNELIAARREVEKAIEHNARNAEAHSILGLIDYLSGVNDFRLLEVDDCLTGVDAESLGTEMDRFFASAQSSFAHATKIDPEYGEAFANEASAYAQLEEFDRAIELNEKALSTPHRLINLGLTRANLGWARFKSGDAAGAAKELRQSLQFNPNMCIAKYRLGRVYFEREEWNKALDQFQAVVETESCPIQEANLYFIRTMRKLSPTDDIQTAVEQCIALAPKSCVAAQCQEGL